MCYEYTTDSPERLPASAGSGFASLLREAREYEGMTQAELAEKTGLQPTAISHFETGARRPCIENLRKLCKALRCSADSLLQT